MAKEFHNTYWQQNKINPDKPYYVLFNTYRHDLVLSRSCTGFDTLKDANEEISLINEMYANTPVPEKIYHSKGKLYNSKNYRNYDYDYSDGKLWWGYALLDMENSQFLKVKGVVKYFVSISSNTKQAEETRDYFFRKNSEIPKDYEWHHNGAEYKGWLQYRWGDGKNAIDYVEKEETKKERPGVTEVREVYDEALDDYVKKKVRVVYVGWNDPLPKREKGIRYERPNHELVVFPGDFGYEGDHSLWPWSLDEEIAEEEYDDIGGFDLKETTQSLSDMLGKDNPLLKLKFMNK